MMNLTFTTDCTFQGCRTIEGYYNNNEFTFRLLIDLGAYTLDNCSKLTTTEQNEVINYINEAIDNNIILIEDNTNNNLKTNLYFPSSICRISYNSNLEQTILQYIRDNNIYQYCNKFAIPSMTNNIEVGYNCIDGLSQEVVIQLQNTFNVTIDNIRSLLTKEVINSLNVDDKIKLSYTHVIMNKEIKGKIHSINDNYIMIKKYRCKTPTIKLYLGQECSIENL